VRNDRNHAAKLKPRSSYCVTAPPKPSNLNAQFADHVNEYPNGLRTRGCSRATQETQCNKRRRWPLRNPGISKWIFRKCLHMGRMYCGIPYSVNLPQARDGPDLQVFDRYGPAQSKNCKHLSRSFCLVVFHVLILAWIVVRTTC
jgi:hypothetical protein